PAKDKTGKAGLTQAQPNPSTKPKIKARTRREPKAKIWAVTTKEIDEPLYREVDAMNGLIATARISAPATLTNFYDVFQKEPDGYEYTVLQGPAPLKLWSNPRELAMLTVSDLPHLRTPPSYTPLAIWTETPSVHQVLLFQDNDGQSKFE